jgi:hypothetical protein
MPSLLRDPDYSPSSDTDESQVSFVDFIVTNPNENSINGNGGHGSCSGSGSLKISESTIEDFITPPTSPVQVVKKRKARGTTNTATSWIWCHFKKLDVKKEFALCLVCDKEVYYSKNYSIVC